MTIYHHDFKKGRCEAQAWLNTQEANGFAQEHPLTLDHPKKPLLWAIDKDDGSEAYVVGSLESLLRQAVWNNNASWPILFKQSGKGSKDSPPNFSFMLRKVAMLTQDHKDWVIKIVTAMLRGQRVNQQSNQ